MTTETYVDGWLWHGVVWCVVQYVGHKYRQHQWLAAIILHSICLSWVPLLPTTAIQYTEGVIDQSRLPGNIYTSGQ